MTAGADGGRLAKPLDPDEKGHANHGAGLVDASHLPAAATPLYSTAPGNAPPDASTRLPMCGWSGSTSTLRSFCSRRRVQTGPTEATSNLFRAKASPQRVLQSRLTRDGQQVGHLRLAGEGHRINPALVQAANQLQDRRNVVGQAPGVERDLPDIGAPFPQRPGQQVVGAAVSLHGHRRARRTPCCGRTRPCPRR